MSLPSTRSQTATLVAIVTPATRTDAIETLTALARVSAVRSVLVSLGDSAEPPRDEEDGAIVIDGLRLKYLNNAVASLRLSSLPTLAWWRCGDPHGLEGLAALVDRVVLDLPDPSRGWPLVPSIAQSASVSDVRWARLTRWRDVIAQFFEMPDVREQSAAFTRLEISGEDSHLAKLLAGWLKSRLPGGSKLDVQIATGKRRLESARLTGPQVTVAAQLRPNGTCMQTTVQTPRHSSTRVVPFGDQRLTALLAEELRVRTRDAAFEDAVREAEQL